MKAEPEEAGLLEVAPSTVQFGGWAELAREGGVKLERSLLITVPASLATGSDSVRVLVSAPCSARFAMRCTHSGASVVESSDAARGGAPVPALALTVQRGETVALVITFAPPQPGTADFLWSNFADAICVRGACGAEASDRATMLVQCRATRHTAEETGGKRIAEDSFKPPVAQLQGQQGAGCGGWLLAPGLEGFAAAWTAHVHRVQQEARRRMEAQRAVDAAAEAGVRAEAAARQQARQAAEAAAAADAARQAEERARAARGMGSPDASRGRPCVGVDSMAEARSVIEQLRLARVRRRRQQQQQQQGQHGAAGAPPMAAAAAPAALRPPSPGASAVQEYGGGEQEQGGCAAVGSLDDFDALVVEAKVQARARLNPSQQEEDFYSGVLAAGAAAAASAPRRGAQQSRRAPAANASSPAAVRPVTVGHLSSSDEDEDEGESGAGARRRRAGAAAAQDMSPLKGAAAVQQVSPQQLQKQQQQKQSVRDLARQKKLLERQQQRQQERQQQPAQRLPITEEEAEFYSSLVEQDREARAAVAPRAGQQRSQPQPLDARPAVTRAESDSSDDDDDARARESSSRGPTDFGGGGADVGGGGYLSAASDDDLSPRDDRGVSLGRAQQRQRDSAAGRPSGMSQEAWVKSEYERQLAAMGEQEMERTAPAPTRQGQQRKVLPRGGHLGPSAPGVPGNRGGWNASASTSQRAANTAGSGSSSSFKPGQRIRVKPRGRLHK
jgi:hypothetical protein